MFEECSDLRFFQTSLINDRKGTFFFFSLYARRFFSSGFKEIFYSQNGEIKPFPFKTLLEDFICLNLIFKILSKESEMSVKQTGIWFILDYIDSSISSQRL